MSLEVTARKRLGDFDLDVHFASEAQRIVLHGPSGSGKSLTLRILAGLLRPDAGAVRLDGDTLFDAAQRVWVPARQRSTGLVFQDYALFPHLNVEENIGFGLPQGFWGRKSAAWRERVDELLTVFSMEEWALRDVRTLSGGQKQRVALARALAPKPRLLLLDEPFAALDESLRREMRSELAQVQRHFGVRLVLVTHDVADVEALADDVVVIDGGRVTRTWSLRKLCRRRNVARFVSSHAPPAPHAGEA